MKNLNLLLILALFLVGCGGGSGGSSGAGGSSNPPPPPIITYQSYAGTIQNKSGNFAAQGNTVAEFHPAEKRLVFSTTPYGDVTVTFLSETSTGWHANIYLNGVQYAVWWWPEENALNISDVQSGVSGASWVVYQIVANG